MTYDYDEVADALYVTVDDIAVERQVELKDGTIVDIGAENRLVGIDVMNPGAGWDPEAVIAEWSLEPRVADQLRALAEWIPCSTAAAWTSNASSSGTSSSLTWAA